ncbi:hypothetical protein FVR03_11690 [Pontibacter qinzhouensis]|uniref:YtxH domain-containing protein n=1 Tax=Pontibacter qinzhouensis TaxID=2603253 RepID=A0A5C8K5E9_9BACT|nr:hypothetical protein [Pontibacter qinzhouensis]TXK45847.1 hypothetical protein FVR03_11690 [Pontibacter qinzhouensis]
MKLNNVSLNASTKLVLSMLIGAISGYLFYAFYGCDGSCMISSSPLNSTLYGTAAGAILSRRFAAKK